MQFEQLQKEMITAMKARDKERKEAISLLIAAVKKEAIDKECRESIPEDMVDSVILAQTKMAKEQVDSCPDSRPELKQEYQNRYSIFMEFAPAQLSEAEIKEAILNNFADLVAAKNKGMIMKNAMALLKGKADGKLINQVVSSLCD